MSKTVLITGASSGFGLMLANDLHKKGFKVIGTSREPEKYNGKFPFKLMKLDIDDDNSINSFAAQVSADIKQLDVLVNNAGFMLTGIAEETPMDAARKQFETNFWGTVKVTNLLLPKFRKQKSGQIITVSSIVGLIGPPNLSFYAASKHAVEGYFKALRMELHQFNIKVSVVEPVWFKTNLGHNAVVSKGNTISDYNNYRNKLDALTQKGLDDAQTPEPVVEIITKIIQTKEPKFSNPVGKQSGMIAFLQNFAPKMLESNFLKSLK